MTQELNDGEPRDRAGARELELARDRKLARRVARGDREAIREFCDSYLPRLYRFALHRVATPADADDVVQVVISNAARRIETFRGEASLGAWLMGICRHEISRHLAAAGRQPEVALDDSEAQQVARLPGPSSGEPETVVRSHELAVRVRECLDAMPERQATALELKYVEGLSSKEIAIRLEMSDEAVQSLLARARRTFRALCDDGRFDGVEFINGGA